MSGLIHGILGMPGWLVLVIAGTVVFTEDALFVGFLLPGETVALLAGAAARLGHGSLAGDTAGYEVGRHIGSRALDLPIMHRHRRRIDDAREVLARRGGGAVFLGRWLAFLRAVMPALAGSARMPYPKFLAWNASGGITWGVTVVLLGYAAGASYAQAEKSFGRAVAVAVLAVVIIALVVWRVGGGRARRRAER
jgi:membrane-associated protein